MNIFSKNRKKWLKVAAVKMEDGFAITINDISRRKNAIEELPAFGEAGDDGQDCKRSCNEVRNPLTNIQLSLHQLNNEIGTNDDAKMYTEIIQQTQTGLTS